MMDDRKMQLIESLLKFLDDNDGDELKSHMGPEGSGAMMDGGGMPGMDDDKKDGVAIMAVGKKPMMEGSPEEEASESPAMEKAEGDDMDDDELEELSKLSH